MINVYFYCFITVCQMNQINVLIVGAGAVGIFYGWKLSKAENVNVEVVCRSNYQKAFKSGFMIESPTEPK